MAGELGGSGVAGQAVQPGRGVHGAVRCAALWCLRPEETAHPGAAGIRSAMKTLRRTLLVLVPAVALGLLAAGSAIGAAAQTPPANPPQSSQDAGKADAEKRRQDEAAKAEAARKAEARKPKRDKSTDRKDPERELEEEEDI